MQSRLQDYSYQLSSGCAVAPQKQSRHFQYTRYTNLLMLFSKSRHIADLQPIPSDISTPVALHDVPPRIALAVENEENWDFDIFELEAATQKRCVELVSQGLDREPPSSTGVGGDRG